MVERWISSFRALANKKFVRNVLVLLSGSAAAQLITLAFSPLLTRLYNPEAFGVLGAFLAILAILGPLAALCFPLAIVLPEGDSEARGLARLSVTIAPFTAAFVGMVIFVSSQELLGHRGFTTLGSEIYLIPVAMFLAACLSTTNQYALRKRLFHLKARVAILQSSAVNMLKAGIGLVAPTGLAMIAVTIFGIIFQTIVLATSIVRGESAASSSSGGPSDHRMSELARRFRHFPQYRAPHHLVTSFTQEAPTLMLAGFVSPTAAGLFTLARTVLIRPANLVAQSVGDVFYPTVTRAVHRGERVSSLLAKATGGLALLGAVPFGTVALFGPTLFSFAFGEEWRLAGDYARWLALMLFCNFINRPTVAAIPALGLQRGLLVAGTAAGGLRLAAFLFGFTILQSDLIAVALFSVLGAIGYLAIITWVWLESKRRESSRPTETGQ